MELAFKELGAGEPLVLLHGLFGSSDNWFGVAPKLAEKFHVLIPDLRNHGRSPHRNEMDYPLMAADVAEFFNARNLVTANVVGHSMGGKTAMQFAWDFPHLVKQLVIVDVAPRQYPPSHHEIFAALLALDLKSFQTRTQMEEALAPKIPDLSLRRFLLKNVGRDGDGPYFWKMNLTGIFQNYPNLCDAIATSHAFEKRTLFLRGEKSNYLGADDGPALRELFSQSEIRAVAGAGHWLHADKPGEFVSEVLAFLQ